MEGLIIKGGPEVEVLNVISLHGGLVGSWPDGPFTAAMTREAILKHWQPLGLPHYAQFDNDTRFQGPHQHPDTIGTVIRLCLSLGVIPVFVPPRESGFQASIESYNGRWQAKVWSRFHHESLDDLRAQSAKYIAACRTRSAPRIDAAPARRLIPPRWTLNLNAPVHGRIIYLRRTDERGRVSLLGHSFKVDRHWSHRLVRSEVDIDANRIRFYALRRKQPHQQPLLNEVVYQLPRRYREE